MSFSNGSIEIAAAFATKETNTTTTAAVPAAAIVLDATDDDDVDAAEIKVAYIITAIASKGKYLSASLLNFILSSNSAEDNLVFRTLKIDTVSISELLGLIQSVTTYFQVRGS